MKQGICKLTGKRGEFVKSHLIPQAFTRPTVSGAFFVDGSPASRPKKNWTSWYDPELVTQEGEKILADYDNWAARELRRLRLVWSGWGAQVSIPVEDQPNRLRNNAVKFRQVTCANSDRLRLFFLSLLWRAAATNLEGFNDIRLGAEDLDRLRRMVVDRDPHPLDFYPTTLLQIVTRGPSHNLGPIAKDFGAPPAGGEISPQFRTFRFYFDGLIAHMHRAPSEELLRSMGSHAVGFSPVLRVQTQTWENSFQFANMKQHIIEATLWWPGVVRKLVAKPDSTRQGSKVKDHRSWEPNRLR